MESGDKTLRIQQSVLCSDRLTRRKKYCQPSLRKRMRWPQSLSRCCREEKSFLPWLRNRTSVPLLPRTYPDHYIDWSRLFI